MSKKVITDTTIKEFCFWLYENEKSPETIKKYTYCLLQLKKFLGEKGICKKEAIAWKNELEKQFSPATVNGALAALNSLCRYKGWEDCKIKFVRIRRRIFCSEQKELSREDYRRLIITAEQTGNERLALLLQTVCSTGIRISELSYITIEAVEKGMTQIDCKGTVRTIFLTEKLCRLLSIYAEKKGILSGMIFITRTGKALDRSNIWREMKKVGEMAGIKKEKVFPHNLRHLFARSYYNQEKDILRLADILGHSSINTTRIYTMESGKSHIRQLEQLGLLIEDYNRISLLW
ncbi:tyrosine-type recombinase/integrase [Lachnospiraceae bacterium 62-35]